MSVALSAGAARAQAQPPRQPIELRASISPRASLLFPEARVRRLLAIELQNSATLSSSMAGPLTDNVAWLWIDVQGKGIATIEARAANGLSSRRTISLGALGSDAAARHIAIAGAEMIRLLSQPWRVRKPAVAKHVCCERAEALERALPTLALDAGVFSALVTGQPAVLAGPAVGVSFRYLNTGARIGGAWFGGAPEAGTLSWAEAGLALDHRWPLGRWRVLAGASAAGASVYLGGVRQVDGVAGAHSSWSARAVALLGVERRIGSASWLSLTVQPGAVLRPVPFELPSGQAGKVSGAWIGLGLGLELERRL